MHQYVIIVHYNGSCLLNFDKIMETAGRIETPGGPDVARVWPMGRQLDNADLQYLKVWRLWVSYNSRYRTLNFSWFSIGNHCA